MTITLTPEQVSINLFYSGIMFLLLGSIARRGIEMKKVRLGQMKTPSKDGKHGSLEKMLMYPLKVLGYLSTLTAIWICIERTTGNYFSAIVYSLFILIYAGIPLCFRPKPEYTLRDNWSVQRERLIAARGTYAVAFLWSRLLFSKEIYMCSSFYSYASFCTKCSYSQTEKVKFGRKMRSSTSSDPNT
jgi:hypothetical protein